MGMSKLLKLILAVNLVAIAAIVFIYPNLMVGPGKLISGHKQLETDCFACHAPLVGTKPEKCIACHKPADIGRLSSKGMPIIKPLTSTPFHQKLIKQDCIACHSDHAGVKRFRITGNFNHSLLEQATRTQCQSCHQLPKDTLHQQITGNCSQCHSDEKWTPATFDHNKYFVLDGDHNTRCVTCHVSNEYQRYTCYGCHEHTPENIRREHIEEGIRNFDNCVECHQSSNEDDIRAGGGQYGSERSEGKHKGGHDD
jgi:hypothetical protein